MNSRGSLKGADALAARDLKAIRPADGLNKQIGDDNAAEMTVTAAINSE